MISFLCFVGGNPHCIFIFIFYKNMKKSFLFIMLVVFLAWAWFGGISMAQSTETSTCEGEVKYWSSDTCASLSDAISSAVDGDVITLLKDVEITTSPIIPINANVTLDLNGKIISKNVMRTEYIFQVKPWKKLTIKDSAWDWKISRINWTTAIMVQWELELQSWIIENKNWCPADCTTCGWRCNWSTIWIKVDDYNDGWTMKWWTVIINWWKIDTDWQSIQTWWDTTINDWILIWHVNAWAYPWDTAWNVKIKGWTIKWNVQAIQWKWDSWPTDPAQVEITDWTIEWYTNAQYVVNWSPNPLVTEKAEPIPEWETAWKMIIKWWMFNYDPDILFLEEDKCSIKNDDWIYEVNDCPTPTDIFLTSSDYDIPMVLDWNTIKLEETKALLKKITTPTAELTAILALNSVEGKAEVLSIWEEKVLFINAKELWWTNTMAFRQKWSTLFNSTSFKDNKTNTDATQITYDLDNAIVPSWADKNEAVKSYNATTDNKWYTIHTKVNYSWFYAPRMYKVTFDTNWSTEEYEAQKVALTEWKATNPWIPTKEWSWFKFWSLSNKESAIEYDFSAEVTGDITLYAIYGDDAFTITWKNWNDIINTGAFASWAMPAYVWDTPSKDADSTCNTYEFKEWSPSVIAVTDETTYTATFTCTSPKSSKSSWGWGGGGSSKVTNTEDTKATTWDTAKVDENNTEENNEEKANDENKNEEKAPMTDAQAVEKFGQEQIDAYKWALENGITTMKTVEAARLDQPLTRAELAKMMVVYIQKVLEKDPIVTGDVSYSDVDESLGDLYGYIKLAYQYQIMWINADGTPIELFNPYGLVTRWEYATVFSRVLFGDKFNKDWADFYTKHLEALKAAWILTNTIPTIQEMRGWVMLMMYRSSQNSEAIENVANTTETNEEEKADEETATASDETKSEANEEEKAEEATNTEATTGDVAETPATQESSETTAENTETTAEATTWNVAEAPTAEASTWDTASN